jgi:hypothetical protein
LLAPSSSSPSPEASPVKLAQVELAGVTWLLARIHANTQEQSAVSASSS